MEWRWKHFRDLEPAELYAILRLRSRVFVVEQNCVYLDCDNLDLECWHLAGYRQGSLVAYLRALPSGLKYTEASLGRVATDPEARRYGYGREVVARGLAELARAYSSTDVRISAQAYLERFYTEFGFVRVGDGYDEDGIPHVEMLRRAPP